MSKSFTERKRIRKSFGRLHEITQIPNLIEVQKQSYDAFLQRNEAPEKRTDTGLHGVLKSIFPIKDYSGKAQLEYIKYQFDKPKYDVDECRQRGTSYGAPLKVTLRLVVWDVDETTGTRSIHDIKEQDVYMGDMPLMTSNGTFVINGTERVIVSQMHRSPGVFFDHDQGKNHSSGKFLFAARIIPYRGSWLDFEFDGKDILNVRIDRRRKLPVTTFLMALTDTIHESMIGADASQPIDPDTPGMTPEEILTTFYDVLTFSKVKAGWKTKYLPEKMRGLRLAFDLVDAKTGEVVAPVGTKMTPRLCRKLAEDGLQERIAPAQELVGCYCAVDLINEKTGEVYVEAGDELTEESIAALEKAGVKEIPILAIDHINVGAYLRNTLAADRNRTREEALMDIYRIMRPGEPPTYEAADALFRGLFFDQERYDLSAVGRVKMNARLGLACPDTLRILRKEDVVEILKVLLDLKDGRGEVDDIDHLGNRRVRSVGELLENQYRMGLVRMERSVRERLGSVEIETAMPNDLINAKPAISVLREFFGSSQLSQFMDQTNPLSEITHKRRVSALGPGGLTRERAGFEVRDVHPTHYGRICPIETPEGPNIGLINSLATYARVNQYGFIETPYRPVATGVVKDDVIYLNAIEEGKYTIAQADAELNEKQQLTADLVSSRSGGEFVMARPEDVNYIDVSPKQVVSVAAALIPFLENDDANRALMGSNMQRQAVPLVHCEAPLVGTGMEATVARDSGAVVVARRSGIVDQVDGNRIVVRVTGETTSSESGVDIYNLRKFQRSNQNTCINQRPLVKAGDIVDEGDIIADGPGTELGELALGRNVLCAFMPWNGYNYEDSILISEKLVRDDVFTSIHIEEFEVMARDTKLGPEEITRDIPNVGDEILRSLDETGIVYVGAEVKAGDVLVGKVTPKGEGLMTAEEKLLRAIFGEKAADVRDTSLRLPPGVSGTIVEVRVFTRRGIEKDERSVAIERVEIERLAKDRDAEKAILERNFAERLRQILQDQKASKGGGEGLKAGKVLSADVLQDLSLNKLKQIIVADDKVMEDVETLKRHYQGVIGEIEERFADKVDKVQRGDDLPPGVLKMIKVFVAVKRKLQPGDKMAGRHGNKGVISRIVPVEDMPYLADGTPVDMVLNPLGVPSRMNVGQILETHLGWACAGIGKQIGALVDEVARKQSKVAAKDLEPLKDQLRGIYGDQVYKQDIAKLSTSELMELGQNLRHGIPIASPVFDGAKEENIIQFLDRAGLDVSGQVTLYDGCTGEELARKVTVGYIYMLKLHHLVDEKIHARSIGPYSLVTQQPLGGKAQFGGQRFGEMEVWALEAYGAAYTLQEMLTIKSDDVAGRTKVYEAIVRGDENFEAGIPESFNVLVKELQSLGLNLEMRQED